jgi:hypothetical protein
MSKSRYDVEFWHPRSFELKLPDVPESLRPKARKVLTPILRAANEYLQEKGRGIKGGECWQTAFLVSLLSAHVGGPLVDYCEGVWTRSHENKWWGPEDDTKIAPHAWNLFEGHVVDLTAEFYGWNSYGEDAPWLHEPLKVYSPQDVYSYALDEVWDCVSSGLWLANGGRETLPEDITKNLTGDVVDSEGLSDPDHQHAFEFVNNIVFKSATERLLTRLGMQKAA